MSIDRFPKKPCKFCQLTTHFAYSCKLNPKVALRRKAGMKRGRMNRVGKQTKQWFITRATWIRKNPPDVEGYWYCYLRIHPWCPYRLTVDNITLDHVVARTRDPSKRFALDNLKPACEYCNEMKGSKSVDQVKPDPVE